MHDHLSRVCFIVCDSGPATHFAEFAKYLLAEGNFRVDIYASALVRTKFEDLNLLDGIRLFDFILDGLNYEEQSKLAIEILDNCLINSVQTIITDIANKFNVKLQEAFNTHDVALHYIRFWCYYDNPEDFIPGDYSIQSGEMMKLSQNILFANMNLIKSDSKIFSDLNDKNIRGIGYYPIHTADKLRTRRETEREILRLKYGWKNIEYIFIYFGGNNKVYYEQAFPIFLSSLSQINQNSLENILFLIHQHPAAKTQNQDGLLFQQWSFEHPHIQIVLSQLTSDEAQIIADGVLYYQTSMAPQFALIGLPIIQIGHEIYKDILVKHNLCETATNSMELMNGLKVLKEKDHRFNEVQLIYDAIGYTSNWSENLQNVLEQSLR